jgi:hypothetical protein
MQDHVFETKDGVVHMLINLGAGSDLNYLSSTDGGLNWVSSNSFTDASYSTAADVSLYANGRNAANVYVNDQGGIVFSMTKWNETNDVWNEGRHVVLDTPRAVSPFDCNPTIERDANGRLWISYAEIIGKNANLSLYFSDDNGASWTSGLTTIRGVTAASSSVISAGDDTGMIISTNNGLYWVTVNSSGNFKKIQLSDEGVAGYYASHYTSVVHNDDIYLTTISSQGHLKLYVYDSAANNWAQPTNPVGTSKEVTSVQLSESSDGKLYLIYDDVALGKISVVESSDDGATWSLVTNVKVPARAVSDPIRFETPEHFTDDLILLVQVTAKNMTDVDGLYQIIIDVDGDGIEAGGSAPAMISHQTYEVYDI